MNRSPKNTSGVLSEFAYEFDRCWACQIDPTRQRDFSVDYPRWLEIHHIAKLCRLHGRWNLCRLCKLCHDLAEGLKVRDENGDRLPNLTHQHILWLKLHHDKANYKRAELAKVWRRGLLPRPAKLPGWFILQSNLHRNPMEGMYQ